jgi:hypothetical protein
VEHCEPDLDAVLHAAWMVLYCQDRGRRGEIDFDFGAIMGELDWVVELHRLVERKTC